MPPVGFEPISAGKRPYTYALDRAANGTGDTKFTRLKYPAGQAYNPSSDLGCPL